MGETCLFEKNNQTNHQTTKRQKNLETIIFWKMEIRKRPRSFRSADVGSGSKVHPTLNHCKAVVGAVVVVVVLVLVLVLVAVVAVVGAAVVSH